MPERLMTARRRVVGLKETTKAIQSGMAAVVYVAVDAEGRLVQPVRDLAADRSVEIICIESMRQLGNLCAIDIGAAAAALLKTSTDEGVSST